MSLCGFYLQPVKIDWGMRDEKRRKQQRWLGQKQYCIIEMTCELKAFKVLPRARS